MERNNISIVPFSVETMPYAEVLLEELKGDKNFNYFKRDNVLSSMLTKEWRAYILLYHGMPAAWGQIQRFLFPRKAHVVRLGFAVPLQYRGVGLGSAIVDYVIKQCKSSEKLVAITFVDNTVMLLMLLRRGFVIEGHFRNEEILDGIKRHTISMARFQGEQA